MFLIVKDCPECGYKKKIVRSDEWLKYMKGMWNTWLGSKKHSTVLQQFVEEKQNKKNHLSKEFVKSMALFCSFYGIGCNMTSFPLRRSFIGYLFQWNVFLRHAIALSGRFSSFWKNMSIKLSQFENIKGSLMKFFFHMPRCQLWGKRNDWQFLFWTSESFFCFIRFPYKV